MVERVEGKRCSSGESLVTTSAHAVADGTLLLLYYYFFNNV